MHSNDEIIEIKKKLETHEKRIKYLEELISGKGKKVIKKSKSIIDHLIKLKSDGFFNQPKTLNEIIARMAKMGYHYKSKSSLSDPLQRAVRQGILERDRPEKNWVYYSK